MTHDAAEKQNCDIIMKGGITSGVVYPLAITELAQTYTFKNIGGTSAGAIAAAAAAAAEYCRQANGSCDGFKEVARLPNELAGGALERLFQPQFSTRSLFKLGLSFVGSSHWLWRFAKALVTLFVLFPLGTLIGALPGAVILYYLRRDVTTPWSPSLWVSLVFLLIVLPSFLMALFNVVVQALWAIPANNYGLCGGSGGNGKNKPLTDWMTEKFEVIAQKKERSNPLVFNDLWTAGKSEPVSVSSDDREINLEMMTTNLTLRRPHRIPLEDEKLFFYFRESEFRNLFPRHIVDYMLQKEPKGRGDDDYWEAMASHGFHPFPAPGALPVVVAARMSLSFPILISTIPLYTFDPSLPENADPRKRPTIERCLFSDGGISSNFPIHFFDSPLPRWPTFGITLSSASGTPRESKIDSTRVSLSQCNRPDQTEEDFDRFDQKWWRLGGFVGSILNILRNWRDQTQARVPGYRDRIATIHLSRSEGGLNLNMPPETIKKLSDFGASAGQQLRRRFNPNEGDGSGLNWENQRWIRYRSFMSVFEQMLTKLKRGFEFESPKVPSYQAMIDRGGVAEEPHPPCRPDDKSPLTDRQKQAAKGMTAALLNLTPSSGEQGHVASFEEGAPEPPPVLVIRPKV
jgi:predicted acylesterase/phospholipase RssA